MIKFQSLIGNVQLMQRMPDLCKKNKFQSLIGNVQHVNYCDMQFS